MVGLDISDLYVFWQCGKRLAFLFRLVLVFFSAWVRYGAAGLQHELTYASTRFAWLFI